MSTHGRLYGSHNCALTLQIKFGDVVIKILTYTIHLLNSVTAASRLKTKQNARRNNLRLSCHYLKLNYGDANFFLNKFISLYLSLLSLTQGHSLT